METALDHRDGVAAIRTSVLDEGRRLGLPEDWLKRLPRLDPLDGTATPAWRGVDAFLTWKRQEMLARQDRLDELCPGLLVEALEEMATADGPRWIRDSMEKIMFALVWPRRTPGMRVQILTGIADLCHCLRESPSMRLFADLGAGWRSTRDALLRLDDRLDLPDDCPWPSLEDLLHAAEHEVADEMLLPAA